MKKFRIVREICFSGEGHFYYYIQQKKFWGWKEIKKVEVKSLSIHFKSYDEAEKYMFENFTGWGDMFQNGNVYIYKPRFYFM